MYIKAPTAKGNCRYVREYPADCRKEIGRTNFVRTLGTRNIAEANKRQKEIDDLYDAEVHNIRSRALIPKEERQRLVASLVFMEFLPKDTLDIDLALVENVLNQIKQIEAEKIIGRLVNDNLNLYLNIKSARKKLFEARRQFMGLTKTPLRIDVLRAIQRYNSDTGEESVDIIEKIVDAVEKSYPRTLNASSEPSTYKLRHVYEKWAEGDKTVRQQYHVKRAYTLLKGWCGDKPINSYTKQDMRDFLAALQRIPLKLPPDIAALPSFRKQYDAVIARNIEGKARAGQTVQNIKDAISSLFELAIDDLDIEMKNPIKKIPVDVKKGSKKRVRHEEEDLQRIFYSPLYKGFESPRYRYKAGDVLIKDAKFWLPLIGLFCGARQEEMAQVHLTDVFEKKGVTYLHVNDFSPTKKVKTAGSIRTVPIHHELIKIGFLDYIKQTKETGESLLFPDLNLSPDNRYAKEFSKWYGRFARRIGIAVQTEHTRKDFHSFRHTFITAARKAKLDTEYIIQIVGHGEGDFGGVSVVHRGYGVYEPETLNEALQKVKYDCLDLSFLYTNQPKAKPLPIKPRPIKKAVKPDAAKATANKVYKLKRPRPKLQPA